MNTRARGVHHGFGGDFRDDRRSQNADTIGMPRGVRRGLDYTPLFKFLLSKVGTEWDAVYSEAISRLDKKEPIFWLVSLSRENAKEVVRVGESSYFSGLYVDDQGFLRIVSEEITHETLEPFCKCCTHTLNGIPFIKKFSG